MTRVCSRKNRGAYAEAVVRSRVCEEDAQCDGRLLFTRKGGERRGVPTPTVREKLIIGCQALLRLHVHGPDKCVL